MCFTHPLVHLDVFDIEGEFAESPFTEKIVCHMEMLHW